MKYMSELIIEPYPKDYTGYKFLTLIRLGEEKFLNIVDNVDNKNIVGYVIDFCVNANIDQDLIIRTAENWYLNNKPYPISVEFSKLDMSSDTSKIIKRFPINEISRIIGPVPKFNMGIPTKIKKRRRKDIPANIEFINKSRKIF